MRNVIDLNGYKFLTETISSTPISDLTCSYIKVYTNNSRSRCYIQKLSKCRMEFLRSSQYTNIYVLNWIPNKWTCTLFVCFQSFTRYPHTTIMVETYSVFACKSIELLCFQWNIYIYIYKHISTCDIAFV